MVGCATAPPGSWIRYVAGKAEGSWFCRGWNHPAFRLKAVLTSIRTILVSCGLFMVVIVIMIFGRVPCSREA